MSDWKQNAACRGTATDRFFPDSPNHYPQALRLCENCPVVTECLEAALAVPENSDRFGVFGGTTPPERRRIRAARRKPDGTPLRFNLSTRTYEEIK